MAYTPDYTEADMSASIMDTIVTGILVIGQFIVIIVLVLLYHWLKKKR